MNENKKSKKTGLIVIALLLAIMLGIAIFIWHYTNKPVSGTIRVNKVDTSDEEVVRTNIPLALSMAVLEHPSTYDEYYSGEPHSDILVQKNFRDTSYRHESRQIGITIKQRTSSLEEDSNYAHRIIESDSYTREEIEIADRTGYVFRKTDGTEVTYFVLNDEYLAIISGTTNNPASDFALDAKHIANSIRWRQP